MKSGGLIPWNVAVICENVQDLSSDGKTLYERRFGEPFSRPIILFGSMIEYQPILAKTSQDSTSSVRKFCQESSKDMCCMRDASGKEIFWSQTLRSWKFWTSQEVMLGDSTRSFCRKWYKFHVPSRRWNSPVAWKRSAFSEEPLQCRVTLHDVKNTTTFLKGSRTVLNR